LDKAFRVEDFVSFREDFAKQYNDKTLSVIVSAPVIEENISKVSITFMYYYRFLDIIFNKFADFNHALKHISELYSMGSSKSIRWVK